MCGPRDSLGERGVGGRGYRKAAPVRSVPREACRSEGQSLWARGLRGPFSAAPLLNCSTGRRTAKVALPTRGLVTRPGSVSATASERPVVLCLQCLLPPSAGSGQQGAWGRA